MTLHGSQHDDAVLEKITAESLGHSCTASCAPTSPFIQSCFGFKVSQRQARDFQFEVSCFLGLQWRNQAILDRIKMATPKVKDQRPLDMSRTMDMDNTTPEPKPHNGHASAITRRAGLAAMLTPSGLNVQLATCACATCRRWAATARTPSWC